MLYRTARCMDCCRTTAQQIEVVEFGLTDHFAWSLTGHWSVRGRGYMIFGLYNIHLYCTAQRSRSRISHRHQNSSVCRLGLSTNCPNCHSVQYSESTHTSFRYVEENDLLNNKKAQLTQRERATAVHVHV